MVYQIFMTEGFGAYKLCCLIKRGTAYREKRIRGVAVLLVLTVTLLQGCAFVSGSGKEQGSARLSSDALISRYQTADQAYREQRWSDAVKGYRVLLALLPDDAFLWFRMGNALVQSGRWNEAIVAFETSLRADPAQHKARFNLSTVHLLAAQAATQQLIDMPSDALGPPVNDTVEKRLAALAALLQ